MLKTEANVKSRDNKYCGISEHRVQRGAVGKYYQKPRKQITFKVAAKVAAGLRESKE